MASRRGGDLTPEDRRIWGRVSGSVTPAKPVKAPRIAVAGPTLADPLAPGMPAAKPGPKPARAAVPAAPSLTPGRTPATRGLPEALEPRRQRRLSRERDPIEARIDLHGYGRFQAQDALTAFLSPTEIWTARRYWSSPARAAVAAPG